MHAFEVQFQNVKKVAVWMERSDVQTRALGAVVLVIVIGADVGHAFRAQQAGQPASDCCFAGGAVAHDAQQDRSSFHSSSSLRTKGTKVLISASASPSRPP